MRKLILTWLIASCFATSSLGQDGSDEIESVPLDTELMLEPTEEIPNPEVHSDGEYTSQGVGKKKRWQLDSGEFDLESTSPKPRRNSGDGDGYSGFRLRLPTKPD